VLGVAATLWLYQLGSRIQDQNDTLKSLASSVNHVAGEQQLAVDSLLERNGVDKPAQFIERYEKASKARDEARRQLIAQQSINETLAVRTKDLESAVAKLTTELESTQKTVEKYEADAKKAPELRERVAELEQSSTKLQHDLDEKNVIAETVEGQKIAELLRKLNFFRYATYFCGALAALLALAAGYLYYRPIQTPDADQEPAQAQPHRIT
jgi:hypothetical protein